MNKEEWRDVVGYEGLYSVSNQGDVINRHGKILKSRLKGTKKDYHGLLLNKEGIKKHVLIHRLVAQAFIPNPNNLPEVDHIGGDKGDNRACCLGWVSSSENKRRASALGLAYVGTKNGRAKLNEADVDFIRLWLKRGYTNVSIAKEFNVTNAQIGHIKNGRSWTCHEEVTYPNI